MKKENPLYDSTADTLLHIKRVNELLLFSCSEFMRRARVHDTSKLLPPEKELFDEFTPKLKNCTYGSEEYKEFLKELDVALQHHYANNSHHPEHYPTVENDKLRNLIDQYKEKIATIDMADSENEIYQDVLTELEDRLARSESSVKGFDLFDLLEMFFDWKAASERHSDGNILKSIAINGERFKLSGQVVEIFKNTAERYQSFGKELK